jgi:hypothetical protein
MGVASRACVSKVAIWPQSPRYMMEDFRGRALLVLLLQAHPPLVVVYFPRSCHVGSTYSNITYVLMVLAALRIR